MRWHLPPAPEAFAEEGALLMRGASRCLESFVLAREAETELKQLM
jgi:hypothetical protein